VTPSARGRSFADGALVIDKPAGPTSHDIVAAVRRVAGGKVGHTGTLDPLATGVLPLLIGRATRLAQFLADAHKIYEADIRFGWATDTGDAAGRPLGPQVDAPPGADRLAGALDRFRGTFDQRPPAYSAKRVGGKRSYDLARADRALELEAVPVTVHALDLIRLDGSAATLRVACSAGFYVRSLAHDLGDALGGGAHLAALRRLASGRFTLDQAIGLERALTDRDAALAAVVPMADILPDLPAVRLSEHDVARVRRGLDLPLGALPDPMAARRGNRVRLLAPDGSLTAVATWTDGAGGGAGALHPAVVLG